MSGLAARHRVQAAEREATPPPAKRSSANVSPTPRPAGRPGSPGSPKRKEKAYSRFVGDVTQNVAEVDAEVNQGDLPGVAVATRDAVKKIQQLVRHLSHTLNEYGLGLESHHTSLFNAVEAHRGQKAVTGELKKEIDTIKNVLQLSEGRAPAVDAHTRIGQKQDSA